MQFLFKLLFDRIVRTVLATFYNLGHVAAHVGQKTHWRSSVSLVIMLQN